MEGNSIPASRAVLTLGAEGARLHLLLISSADRSVPADMLQLITPLYTHYATRRSPWSHYISFSKKTQHLLHGITVVYIRQIRFQLRQISNPNHPYPSFPEGGEFKTWQIPKHLPAKSWRSGLTISLIALFWMNACLSYSCKELKLFFCLRKIVAQLSICHLWLVSPCLQDEVSSQTLCRSLFSGIRTEHPVCPAERRSQTSGGK